MCKYDNVPKTVAAITTNNINTFNSITPTYLHYRLLQVRPGSPKVLGKTYDQYKKTPPMLINVFYRQRDRDLAISTFSRAVSEAG